jgi:hypothetical protein
MKYADRAFDGFLQLLRNSDFFDNGILMVVSDHRSMTPIPSRELDTFGSATHSRVPAFIIGPGFGPGGEDSRVLSQSDIVPGFDAWLRGETRLDAFQSLMFAEMAPGAETGSSSNSRCAFHSRGDRRGLVEVLCNTGGGQVELRGDDSRFISQQGLDTPTQQSILDTMAILRITAQQRHERQQSKNTGQENPGRN